MKTPTIILFLVNLAAVIGYCMLHADNHDAILFGLSAVLWSFEVLFHESSANFRIRLLEHQKSQLETGKNSLP